MGQCLSLETGDPIIGKNVVVNKQRNMLSDNAFSCSNMKWKKRFRSHRAVIKKEFSIIALSSDNVLSPKTQATNPETPVSLTANPDLVAMITPVSTTHLVASHDKEGTEQSANTNNTSTRNSTSNHQKLISHKNGGEVQLSSDLNVHFFPSQELESGWNLEEVSTSSDEPMCDVISVDASLCEIDVNQGERDQDLLSENHPLRLARQIKSTSQLQSNMHLTRTLPMQESCSPTATESRLEGNSDSKKQSLSLEKHIMADFKNLKVQVQLKEYQEKEDRRRAKYNERYADVKSYRQLHAVFEELQIKSKSHQEELDKMEPSKRELRSLDLSQSSSWYFDFESLEIEQCYFDVGDDQSKYSLLSAPSRECQIRYYTSKKQLKNVRNKSDSSLSNPNHKITNTKAVLEDIVKGSSESLEKHFPKAAPLKEVDYGPVNRRLQQKDKSRTGDEEFQRKESTETMLDYGPLNFTAQKHGKITEDKPSALSLNSFIGISSKLSTVPFEADENNLLAASDKYDRLQQQSPTRLGDYHKEERMNNISSENIPKQIQVEIPQQSTQRIGRDQSPEKKKSILSQEKECVSNVATSIDNYKKDGDHNDTKTDCNNILHEEELTIASASIRNIFPQTEKKEIESNNMIIPPENEMEYNIATMSSDKFLHMAEENTFLRI